ncbi:FMN-binding negative transcriptional regulator [Altererythrobacter salegens]|uniref:FMN-binding negative transcriptional regulator n=1 Tax=Croceibacterium salegens TaxID=1737568 RepID=A0A6I4SQL6_9SPHN|nr:FMN-binding negative transcriptional regulator [Croceibacterium salegens]MXO58105.1 FMN-binding negative transcriptional regulator [Croceibacterium salegens]
MHPNPVFRSDDRALLESLIDEIGFGMIFAQTPDGPRVAHVPIVSTGDGAIRFHLSNGNALAKHIASGPALAVINGPDAYVSPRWYPAKGAVPTWNYVTLELEGPVRRMESEGLEALLEAIAEREEGRIAEGEAYTSADVPPEHWSKLIRAITGFELEVRAWRPTFKLSQNKSVEERSAVADALEAQGSLALASLMRGLAK